MKKADLKEAVTRLRAGDSKLAGVINSVGPCTFERGAQGFPFLVNSIIGQQLSSSSARAIRTRLEAFLGDGEINPEVILATNVEGLREVGMSWAKAGCLHGLAEMVSTGEIDFPGFETMEDDEVVKSLTRVKGIGRWTAEMFLMFSLGRPDVFPVDDQSIRSAVMRLYDLTKDTFKTESALISDNWRPYRTIASWYLYRYLDLPSGKEI